MDLEMVKNTIVAFTNMSDNEHFLEMAEFCLTEIDEFVENNQINPTHETADAFWSYWKENGETHKHGYYESTWGAINAALKISNKNGVIE